MDDKTIMESVLSNSKNLCDLMLHGSIESSSSDVHSSFCASLSNSVSMQNKIYSAMEKCGFYKTSAAESQKIMETKQKFSNSN